MSGGTSLRPLLRPLCDNPKKCYLFYQNFNNHTLLNKFIKALYNFISCKCQVAERMFRCRKIALFGTSDVCGRIHQTLNSRLNRTFSSRLRDRPAPVVLTERAAKRIQELLSSKDDAAGVRVSVRRRGCNGYSYTMNYVTQNDVVTAKDEVVNAYGITVLVDPKAIFFIVGTTMDFVETELSSEFTFTNPNSKGQCGCGESFNV